MRPVAMLVGVLLLAGCSRPTPKLDALESDPMASVSIPGLKLVREDGGPEGEAMGKPVIADYMRIFEVTAGSHRSVLREVRDLAEANGWKTNYVRKDAYVASKTLIVHGEPLDLPADLSVVFASETSVHLRMTQE